MDHGGGAALALLGEVDGDLEFFQGLFDDLPSSEAKPSSPPIRAKRRRRLRSTGITNGGEADSGEETAAARAVWKKVAWRMKKERTAAEKENARLRKVARVYTQTTQQMWKLTEKAALLATKGTFAFPRPGFIAPYIGPQADLVRITRDLDVLARGAREDLLSDHTRLSTDLYRVENRILQTAVGQVLESTVDMEWIQPFDVASIAGVLLANSIRLVTRKNQRNVQTIYENSQLKVVHAVSGAKDRNGSRTTKHGQLATRLEPATGDGSRLLTIATRGGFAVDSTMVLAIDGGGYIHVAPVPGHDSGLLGPLSRVHWHRRIRARPTVTSGLAKADHARWIHGITLQKKRKAERQVDKIAQAIENLLLDGSTRNSPANGRSPAKSDVTLIPST